MPDKGIMGFVTALPRCLQHGMIQESNLVELKSGREETPTRNPDDNSIGMLTARRTPDTEYDHVRYL